MWLPAKIFIDYDNIKYFQHLVNSAFNIKYLIFVTNQYGPDKINIYAAVEPANSVLSKNETPKKRKKRKRKWVRF